MPQYRPSLVERSAIALGVLAIVAYWVRFLAAPSVLFYFALGIVLIAFVYPLLKKKSAPQTNSKLDLLSLAVPLIICAFFSLQMLFLGYTASNDALHSVLVNLIQSNGEIPATYAPYSDTAFGYTVGFHSLASYFLFADAFVLDWLFGLIFVFLIVALLINLLADFVDKKTAILAGLLLLGTKMIFLEFFYGMYPRLFAIAMLLLCIILVRKNSRLWFLPFSTILLVHPMYAIVGFLWVAVEIIKSKKLGLFVWILPVAILVLPALIQSYPVYFMNFFGYDAIDTGQTPLVSELSQGSQFLPLSTMVLFFGGAVFAAWAVLSGAFLIRFRKAKSSLLWKKCLFYLLFFAFFFVGAFISTKFFGSINSALVSIGSYVLLVSLALLAQINKKQISKLTGVLGQRFSAIFIVCIVILLILANIGSSSDIQKRMIGSKISPSAAEFAFEFGKFDQNLEKTFFFADSSGKIAEYSRKIPADTLNSFFLPLMNSIGTQDAYKNELAKIADVRSTVEKCKTAERIGAFESYGAKYVVVDTAKYLCRFDWPVVFTQKAYIVYDTTQKSA